MFPLELYWSCCRIDVGLVNACEIILSFYYVSPCIELYCLWFERWRLLHDVFGSIRKSDSFSPPLTFIYFAEVTR